MDNAPESVKRDDGKLIVLRRAKRDFRQKLDAENWMKCYTEFCDRRRHSSVVTREFSDWSTMPDLSDSAPVWWHAVRKKDSIESSCSIDGKNFTTMRLGLCAGAESASGIMCGAPEEPEFEALSVI